MNERMIFAGFGGQGILTIGKLVTACAMKEGRHVTFFPAYGGEVRGGTANCHVIITDEPIASPLVEEASALLVMNEPSLNRFKPVLAAGGLMVLNVSMVEKLPTLDSAEVLAIPATELASEIGDVRVANTIMLSALNTARGLVKPETLHDSFVEALAGRRAKSIPANEQALDTGRRLGEAWLKNSNRTLRR